MAKASIDRLLSMLPEHVCSYSDALVANDLPAEELSRREICSIIEYLLGVHLDGCKGWVGSLVDGVLPASLTISDSAVVVIGLAVWYSNRESFLDPVVARVELSPDRKSVWTYSLRFGDAEAGLGKFPYVLHSKNLYRPPPEQWCFVFGPADAESGDAPGCGGI